MSGDLQVQAQMGSQLVSSLDSIVTNSKVLNTSFESQLNISNELSSAVEKLSRNFNNFSHSLTKVAEGFKDLVETGSLKNDFSSKHRELEKSAKEAASKMNDSASTLEQVSDDQDKMTDSVDKKTRERRKFYKQSVVTYKERRLYLRVLDSFFVSATNEMKNLTEKFKKSPFVQRAIKTSGWSLLIDIPRMIIVSAFKVVGSLIGMAANLFKTTMALPLMLAKICVQVGNEFRTDIIENIGNAYQATKEYSDANSLIGKGISNLRNIAVGSLKEFENPRSQLVKLFSLGVGGAQKFLTDTSKSIDDMGMMAELFGHQVSNSIDSALFLAYARKGLGLASKDIGYYALDAGTHLESIHDRIERSTESIKLAAKMHSVDTKQVSMGFHKLRSNIKDFGHLTDQNLANLVSRMRQLNVGAEDLTSVFGKFKSFEDASKTSAMLYQSFQMNVDALSLLTAKDPGEIVESFRDAMFATGKSYEDLNRHEKQLMQQTTGMSDAMLKSLMTYQNMGLTYEEAKQRVANDDPTKKQIEAIKGLSSSITKIQKVMTFKSPFEAFMKGLQKNMAGSKKAKRMATALSKMYESLYLFGLYLDKNTIKKITTPVILILRKINDVFKGPAFKGLLSKGTSLLSDTITHVSGGLTTKGGYKKASKTMDDFEAMKASGSQLFKRDSFLVRRKLQNLIGKGDKEVLKYLQKKNIIGKDKKLLKSLTVETILEELKSTSLHMSSPKGKKSITSINSGVHDYTQKLLFNYFQIDEFKKNRGLQGQINKTTKSLKEMLEAGTGPLGTIFDLGRKMMGGIIKGAAIGLTTFLHVLNGTVDKAFENMSSPIANMTRNMFGLKPGKQFSILSWLGISSEDEGTLIDKVAEAATKLIMKTPKLFKIGSWVLVKIYGVFKDLAYSLISSVAGIFIDKYDDPETSWWERFKMGRVMDSDARSKARALKQYRKGMTLESFSKKSQKTRGYEAKRNQHMIYGETFKYMLEDYKNKYKLGPYGDALKSVKAKKYTTSHTVMRILNAIKEVKAYESQLPYEEYLKIKEKKEVDKYLKYSAGKIINSPGFKLLTPDKFFTKSRYPGNKMLQNYAAYAKMGMAYQESKVSHGSRSSTSIEKNNDYISHMLNSVVAQSKKKPKSSTAEEFVKNWNKGNFKRASHNKISIEDGTISSKINSILTRGGLKLFTDDGKIIVPHSMDELIKLTGDDKNNLINVFSNIGLAYSEVANAVTVLKTENVGSKDDYIASDELIDKMMNLVYETLEICINRDIKVNKVVTL